MESTVNTRVIFSAVRKGKNPNKYGNVNVNPSDSITFDETVTNIGDGMDPESGVFTAPVSGIYSFSFSAILHFERSRWGGIGIGMIKVLKDEQLEFYIEETERFPVDDVLSHDLEVINHSWMMSLVQNEKVRLKMDGQSLGKISVHNDPKRKNFVWFNGQLLYASE